MSVLKLSDLVSEMDFQLDEVSVSYHITKNEFIMSSDDFDDEEDIDDINPEDLLDIPGKYEIHEYQMMENYSLSLKGEHRDACYNAIQGRGAFRGFKDTIYRLGIEKEWFLFRDQCYACKAREWCAQHEIEFEDDVKGSLEKRHNEMYPPSGREESEIDEGKIDDCALALLYLTMNGEDFGDFTAYTAWKGLDWGVMNRLYEEGYLNQNPRSKTKSVHISEEGAQRAEEMYHKLFGKDS